MAIKLRRGNKADLVVENLQQGEPVVALDTKEFGIKGRESDMIWQVPANRLIAGIPLTDDILLSQLVTAGVLKGENLLHNWYFPNPVNQRGVSGTISTTGYFIDRWILTSGSVTLTSNGLTLNGTMTQILEYAVGTDVTASVSMYSGTATASYNNSTKTFTITSSGGTIRAAKLEKGTVSTLPNDAPPDYGEQLSICQRYQFAIKSYSRYAPCWVATNWIDFAISLPCNMRVKPTFAINNMAIQNDGTEITGFTFSNPSAGSELNVIVLRATKNAHGLTNPSLTTKTNTVSLFDANL